MSKSLIIDNYLTGIRITALFAVGLDQSLAFEAFQHGVQEQRFRVSINQPTPEFGSCVEL